MITAAQSVFAHSSEQMPEIASGEADLIITSPPYFPNALYAELKSGECSSEKRFRELRSEILRFTLSQTPVIRECSRILKSGGFAVFQVRDVRMKNRLIGIEPLYRMMLEQNGFCLCSRHLWKGTNPKITRRKLQETLSEKIPVPFNPEVFLVFQKNGDDENALSFAKPGEPLPEDEKLLSSDFMLTAAGHIPERHPFQSPVPVIAAFMRTYSKEGELVADPYGGGGTTGVVARRLNRNCFLYEIDADFAQLCQKNIERTLTK